MDIGGIETFLAIAELGSFTRAAGRLHRSQPAISRRLGLLEDELGAPLFERLRGRARLTDAGRALLPHAEVALASLRDGREAVRGLQTGVEGVISLALVGSLADTHIVDALRRFAAESVNVRLELRTATSRDVTDLVRRGDATLGLRYHASERPELVSVDAGSEAMLVVAAPGHRLALVPQSSVHDELRSGNLVVLNVPSMLTTIPITAIYRRNGYLSAAAQALLALLTNDWARSQTCRAGLSPPSL